MDYIYDKVLREVVKFLEYCQICILNGTINLDAYYSLTSYKIEFLNEILDNEKDRFVIDCSLKCRLDKIVTRNRNILAGFKKAAGT